MGILEEIQRMQQSGLSEEEIISKLQEQGNPYRDISEAMAQSKIKQAVEDRSSIPEPPTPSDSQTQGMQQSIIQPPQQEAPQQEYFPEQQEFQNQGAEYVQQGYDSGQSSSLSSDTIMEISEQIVSEKMTDIRKKMEKISIFKTELETKTESIEERLKRIEKIIDTLQTSVLRKVGDYVTNVEDLKHEMIETQKTFAKVLGSKHHEKEHKK
ncbi:hypothetical protein J4423_05150 [Candidatus Pacearchaeota archaeon]|nr:hypothetical protein [Candidatus Pacearchaeota archaeon]